jgi:hypothetical protein
VGFTLVDTVHSRSFVTTVQSINVGDSKERVAAILGQAIQVFKPPRKTPAGFYFGVLLETWAYGKRFDWQHCFYSEFPYFCPLKFRIFGPAADDVAVEFDSAGRVVRISRPTRREENAPAPNRDRDRVSAARLKKQKSCV